MDDILNKLEDTLEQIDQQTGKRCYIFHRDTNGKKRRKNKPKMEEAKLIDRIYKTLSTIPEFRNLSMDRQGEISVKVKEMIGR